MLLRGRTAREEEVDQVEDVGHRDVAVRIDVARDEDLDLRDLVARVLGDVEVPVRAQGDDQGLARERELGLAYRIAAEAQNRLGLTEPLDSGTADQVIDSTPALGDLRYARAVTSVSGI